MATQAELIAQAKRDWELANKSGNKAGMDLAHKAADTARGYTTDASGVNRMETLKTAVSQPSQSTVNVATQLAPQNTMTGRLVNYRDQAGNLQTLDDSYESSGQLPQGWVRDTSAPNLKNALSQPQSPVTSQPKVNLSDMISQRYKSQTDSIVSALKQKIAESKASQEALIKQAPQRYDPLRAESEVMKAQSLRSTLERSANLGDRGGIGRSEALATQTAGENRLSGINLQQQNFIDTANAEIARLESEGRAEEAQILADQRNRELQDLMSEAIRMQGVEGEELRYQQGIQRDDTRYNQGIARDDAALASDLADRERNRQLETLGQYSSDYQAQINKLQSDADPSNDWLVPYLAQARGEKIAGIEAGKARAEQTNYERALAEQKRQDAINAATLKAAADKAKLDAELKIKQQTANKPKVTKPAAQPMW